MDLMVWTLYLGLKSCLTYPPASSFKRGPEGRMMKHNKRKNTLMEERVNKITLNVSFLQETAAICTSCQHSTWNCLRQRDPPILSESLGWRKRMKTHNNLTTSTQIHKHEQTVKSHNLHTFSTHSWKNSLLINSRFIVTALKHWFFCSCCCTTCWLLNYTLRKMLMEETWRSGNFIMTQMGTGTTRWEEVREGVKLNRTYALCRRQQWFFFFFSFFCCFHQLIGFYGAHRDGGKEDGERASGLHLKPSAEPLKW